MGKTKSVYEMINTLEGESEELKKAIEEHEATIELLHEFTESERYEGMAETYGPDSIKARKVSTRKKTIQIGIYHPLVWEHVHRKVIKHGKYRLGWAAQNRLQVGELRISYAPYDLKSTWGGTIADNHTAPVRLLGSQPDSVNVVFRQWKKTMEDRHCPENYIRDYLAEAKNHPDVEEQVREWMQAFLNKMLTEQKKAKIL